MAAFNTLFPVFFMLGLGMVSKKKKWLTPSQKEGVNSIVFNLLFPVLIFNLMCQASIEMVHLKIVFYVFIVYLLAMFFGKKVAPMISKEYAHVIPYLFPCCEGGNVALPLYLSIVVESTNTVIYDLAGTVTAFIVIPILVARASNQGSSLKDMIKSICTNSFVIAVVVGLVLNFTGLYQMIISSSFGPAFSQVITNCTAPIVPLILFVLGYDFEIDNETIKPILKFIGFKTVYYAIVIAGFFVLVPNLMADKIYLMAPIIYFMSPTGFPMPTITQPIHKSNMDKSFMSGAISIYMIVTLVVYTAVVLFIA